MTITHRSNGFSTARLQSLCCNNPSKRLISSSDAPKQIDVTCLLGKVASSAELRVWLLELDGTRAGSQCRKKALRSHEKFDWLMGLRFAGWSSVMVVASVRDLRASKTHVVAIYLQRMRHHDAIEWCQERVWV
jgi:hypothetical protein